MASRFVLTAQVQLQAPTNTRQVVNQIQRQLSGVNVKVNLQGGQQAAKQVNNITKATKQATTQAQKMGKAFGTSIRRFSAFSIASRGVSLLTNGLANATNEAIAFEREMVKISQVTGKTMGQLKGLENTITDLATSFGVSSKSILSVGRILAQAGIQARDLDVALTTLAKTELAPTFEDITKTAEGAVAIIAQFGEGVGALERQLGAINRVAGQFAVESGDLISVIRRTGGVFKAAGGDLEELIALFTSVRATTRESAESIATGLRTIFTRIQRPKTIEFLKQFGVELTDLNGRFIGPYEAVRQLSQALSGLGEGDIRFVKIAEELGGFRQIGKVIPLLQQFEVAERARQAALEGGTSLDEDAAKAQKALAVQISKVKEEFQALIRSITQSSAFQVFVKTALELSSAFIRIADTLKPLIPLLATVAAFKFARGAAGFARGIGAGLKGAKGFNTGGVVPGTGNRDTVPAMLTPGEFVIRKSSVQSIGAGNLAAMNAKGYAQGGAVNFSSSKPYVKLGGEVYSKDPDVKFDVEKNRFDKKDVFTYNVNRGGGNRVDLYSRKNQNLINTNAQASGKFALYEKARELGRNKERGNLFEDIVFLIKPNLKSANRSNSRLDGVAGTSKTLIEIKSTKKSVSDKDIGEKLVGASISPISTNVDALVDGLTKEKLRPPSKSKDIVNLGSVSLIEDATTFNGQRLSVGNKPKKKRNAGGGISGSDTVPAMLTPGEFVFSKKAAQSIGYSNLSRMNTQGVQGFAKGGAVGGVQYLNSGGVAKLQQIEARLASSLESITSQFEKADADSKALNSSKPEAVARANAAGASLEDKANLQKVLEEEVKAREAFLATSSKKEQVELQLITIQEKIAKKLKGRPFGKEIAQENKSQKGVALPASPAAVSAKKDRPSKEVNKCKCAKEITKFNNDFNVYAKASVKDLRTFGKNFNKVARKGGSVGSQPTPPPLPPTPPPVTPLAPKGDKDTQTQEQNRGVDKLQNILLAASAMSVFIPQVEDATEGFAAIGNVIPAAIAGFGALTAVSLQLPKFEINDEDKKSTKGVKKFGNALSKAGAAALKNAALTTTAFKVIDAYSGVHLKAEKAIKNASESNDEASLITAQRAAAESANQEALNTAATGVGAAFAAVGSAIPGPLGKLVSGFGIVAAGFIKFGALESLFGITGDALQDFFSVLGLGPSAAQAKAQTTYTIQSARAQRVLAESAKKASEELKEIEAGNLTATASLGAGGAAATAAKATAAQTKAAQDLVKANKDQIARVKGSGLGNVIDLFTGQTGSLEQANKSLEKEQIKAGQDFIESQRSRFAAATKEQVVASAAAGGSTSFDDFFGALDPSIRAVIENTDKMNNNSDEVDKLRKNFENQKKAVIDNIKFIKAMNFGLSEVTSGIQAYSSSLNNLVAAQETGFSTAGFAAETLATAMSSAGKFVSSSQLGQSLNALEDNLKRFGANADQITDARALITGLNDLQKNASDALLAVKSGFKGGATSPEAIKNQIRDAIIGSIPDSSPIRQKLIDSFGKLELPPEAVQEFLNTGDVSVILDKAFGPIQEQVQKQLIGPLRQMAEQEKILISLTQQRREAEKKLISVQQQAIDAQIDAAKAFEEFGGAKFTPEREFDARRQQANLVLRDAGVQGLAGGSVNDIRAARDQISSNFSRQQQLQNAAAAGGGGAFGGAAGFDKDRREELKAANDALINFTKQGIQARKQELDLIKKKNAAEKQALDSLLSGDIESFFDQAIGAAAGSALRTGNAQVAGLFGAGALGRGLQGIQDTGLSDVENKRAASIAFGAFGLGGDAASVFTGTTREEEQIKAQGRELALMQGELASQSAEMEEMTVQAKEVVISAANVRLSEIGQQVSSAQAALNFNRGGTVYANRGMFIPRGTDTVPAMLTPGEFVVNRAAVQRGNNLQILRSMNSNSAPIQAAQGLSSGGPVRYRAAGSTGPELGGGMDFSKFEELVNKFQEVTDKLGNVNIKHMFEKLGTLDINHMFNGNMQQAFKDEILAEAGNMMSRSKFNSDGSITTSDRSVLG